MSREDPVAQVFRQPELVEPILTHALRPLPSHTLAAKRYIFPLALVSRIWTDTVLNKLWSGLDSLQALSRIPQPRQQYYANKCVTLAFSSWSKAVAPYVTSLHLSFPNVENVWLGNKFGSDFPRDGSILDAIPFLIGPSVRSIGIQDNQLRANTYFHDEVAKRCPKLRHISFLSHVDTDRLPFGNMDTLVSSSKELRTVRISVFRYCGSTEEFYPLLESLSKSPQLQHLELHWIGRIPGRILSALQSSNPIPFAHLTTLSKITIDPLTIPHLVSLLPHITTLSLRLLYEWERWPVDGVLHHLLPLHNIRNLSISFDGIGAGPTGTTLLTDSDISTLCTFQNLSGLTLKTHFTGTDWRHPQGRYHTDLEAPRMTVEVLETIASNSPNLETLYLDIYLDPPLDTLVVLGTRCRQLKTLALYGAFDFSNLQQHVPSGIEVLFPCLGNFETGEITPPSPEFSFEALVHVIETHMPALKTGVGWKGVGMKNLYAGMRRRLEVWLEKGVDVGEWAVD